MNKIMKKILLSHTIVVVQLGLAVLGMLITPLAASAWAGTTIVDQSGNKIVINTPFKRIISLYGAHTENLFYLGLDKEIIGVSKNEVYPPPAMTKEVFSYHDDAEKFIAAQPDLVLIRPMIANAYPDFVVKLQKAGITVVSLQPRTIEDVYEYWRDLGRLTGRSGQAEAMVKEFEATLGHIRTLVKTIPPDKRKKVYFEAIHSRMKTFSPASIAMFALTTAGGINVATDAKARHGTNIAAYGKEHILSLADNIEVYLAQKGAMNRVSIRKIREEPGFKVIRAVRSKHIYLVDEKIVSRPTLRLLDGIYEIGRFLYPAVFNDVADFKNKPVLSRSQFAEMFVKMTNMPLKTPDYWHDIRKRAASARHKYGDFADVDYNGKAYKFIETAVYRGLFPNIKKGKFYPDKPVKRRTVAYALFVYFDLPEVDNNVSTRPRSYGDVKDNAPFYEQIQTAAELGLIPLTADGLFRPAGTASGAELFRTIILAVSRYSTP
jgi:iron complex transport system substrate-binding protein